MSVVTFSEDLKHCPTCESELVRTTRVQRLCTTCGLTADYISPEEERDAKDRPGPRTGLIGSPIGRHQQRW